MPDCDEHKYSPGPNAAHASKSHNGFVYEEDGLPLFKLQGFAFRLSSGDFAKVEHMENANLYCSGDMTAHRDESGSPGSDSAPKTTADGTTTTLRTGT